MRSKRELSGATEIFYYFFQLVAIQCTPCQKIHQTDHLRYVHFLERKLYSTLKKLSGVFLTFMSLVTQKFLPQLTYDSYYQ